MSNSQKAIDDNLHSFWACNGDTLLKDYCEFVKYVPEGSPINKAELNERLRACKTLILTANSIEGIVLTRLLMRLNRGKLLDRITADKRLYQFAEVEGIKIVHIWPDNVSSFTQHGAFKALSDAFKHFLPERVISLGVAFGADVATQKIGDVLVSKSIIPYDAFNKVTNGTINLEPAEVYQTDVGALGWWSPFLKQRKQLYNFCSEENRPKFNWFYGPLLSGGTVLSDIAEKGRLFDAAKRMSYDPIGGEMEGNGVYFACEQASVPCIVIKGISDWGVQKNAWEFAKKTDLDIDTIKDCVQAYAADNAFFALRYLLKQLPKEVPVERATQQIHGLKLHY